MSWCCSELIEQAQKMLIGAAAWVLNSCDLVGLWCYIRSRRLGVAWLWKLCLALTAAQLAFVAGCTTDL
jgi:hypothetical protein